MAGSSFLSNIIDDIDMTFPARANNGMHPTADTLLVMYIESHGAAGDAER